MTERKLLLKSRYKALLYHCSAALVSFLFPFNWSHAFIPVLPPSMKAYLEAPFPFIIGLHPDDLTEDDEIPEDIWEVNLDEGVVNTKEILKLPTKELKNLVSRLRRATSHIQRPDPMISIVDEAFSYSADILSNQ